MGILDDESLVRDDQGQEGRFPGNPLWGDEWGWALFKGDAPDKQVATDIARIVYRAIKRLRTKRIYERPDASDGRRILIDRLWPRGVTREQATVHVWMKEIAPSPSLRRWFGHDPDRWLEFRKRHTAELAANEASIHKLASLAAAGSVTLLYATRDEGHNHALVLADYMRKYSRRRAKR